MLDHIVQTYADHHNRFRPHQGPGNCPPAAFENPRPQRSEIDPRSTEYQSWLGWLLSRYYRQAA